MNGYSDDISLSSYRITFDPCPLSLHCRHPKRSCSGGFGSSARTWEGSYVGGSLGYVWGDADSALTTPALVGKAAGGLPTVSFGSYDFDDLDFGIHAGHRWQSGTMVYGVELGYIFRPEDVEIGDTVSLRGMIGTDVNDTLLFASLGLSSADVGINLPDYSGSERLTGYNVGIGAERMISDRWSVRGELIYTDLGSIDFSNGVGNGTVSATMTELRVGLNYNF